MTTCSIGVSAARARLGWMAVVHRPPPAIAAPAATEPFRNVRRDRVAGTAASSGDRWVTNRAPGLPWRPRRESSLVGGPLPAGGQRIIGRITRTLQMRRSGGPKPSSRRSGAEAAPVLDGDQRPLAADLELLHRPRVAIRVGEAEEGAAVAFVEPHDLAGLDAAIEQLLARGLGVGHDQLQALDRAGDHLALRREVTEDDRTARARGRQLDDVHVLVVRVVIEVEADLVAIERDGAI